MPFRDIPLDLGWLKVRCEQGDEEACRAMARTIWMAICLNEIGAAMLLGLWPPKLVRPQPSPPSPPKHEIRPPPRPTSPPLPSLSLQLPKDVEKLIPTEIWVKEGKRVRDNFKKVLQSLDMHLDIMAGSKP